MAIEKRIAPTRSEGGPTVETALDSSCQTTGGATSGWLFVLSWSLRRVGGVSEVVKSLIRCFREGGTWTPQLLIAGEKPRSVESTETELIEAHYLDIWSPTDRTRPVRSLLSFFFRLPHRCRALSQIISRHKIEVINPHFPGLECLLFVFMKKLRLFKGMIVLSFHGSDVRLAHSSRGLERKLWKTLLWGVDHLIVVSDDLGKEVLALERTAAKKLVTIYNGVDLALFTPSNLGTRIPQSGLNEGKTIISIGAFQREKGHDVLVRAFARVARDVPDARLVIVGGDGPEAEPLRRLINSLSLAEKVAIHKDIPHERIPEFLSEATLFALASRSESFGLAVTEAAATKLPVVCTRAKGLRELIVDGVTGTLVDIDDHVAMADAIVNLLMHPEEARRMATNFYREVRSNLTWQHTYEKYLQLVGHGN
jgi:L-malate glycosyltransferase